MFFTPKFTTLTAICLSLAVIPRPVRAATIDVVVGGTGIIAYTPNQVQANVGDVIQFTFKQKNHTITRSTLQDPCTPLVGEGAFDSGFVPVDANATSDFPQAQLTVQDTNPIWIFCRQTGHCGMGMVFAVNPGNDFTTFQAAANATGSTSAPASGVTTVTTTVTVSGSAEATTYTTAASAAPTSSSVSSDHVIVVGGTAGNVYTPSNITAQPGDTVTFQFHSKNHTATQSSFADPCRALAFTSTTGQVGFDSGFNFVDANATTFPTYTIQVNDTAPIWVYCRQQGHCGSGMVFSVNANEAGPNNFAAFQALAIKLNGTSANTTTSTTNNTSDAFRPVRSAAAIVTALVGVVVGLVL